MSGASLEECQHSLKTDYSPEEAKKIISTWAGTGVGLIEKTQPAGVIVREVRHEAIETIKKLTGLFS
jgi:nitronate monooxygenase